MDYEPLSDLLHNAKHNDVLVLCGPFVDVVCFSFSAAFPYPPPPPRPTHPRTHVRTTSTQQNHPKLSGGDVDIETEDGVESVDYDTFFNFKVELMNPCTRAPRHTRRAAPGSRFCFHSQCLACLCRAHRRYRGC